jgi:hypothetical protein
MRSGLIEVRLNNGLTFVGWASVEVEAPEATSGAAGKTHTTEGPVVTPSPRISQGGLSRRRSVPMSSGAERAEQAVQEMRIRLQSWKGVV